MPRGKRTRAEYNPNNKKRTGTEDRSSNYLQEPIKWSFELYDNGINYPKDRLEDCNNYGFCHVIIGMKSIGSQTFGNILQNKKRNHPIPTNQIATFAQQRLVAINLDDLDSLFSLRLNGTGRFFGKLVDNVFHILWWDPDHVICPSTKKHT